MATLAELRKQTRCVHTLASEKIKTLSLSMERNFTWLSEILIEAKRSFASSELQLLPKTPSMKRKCQVRVQQRNIVDESSEEDAPPAKKKRNANRTRSSPKGKKVQVTDTSMLDSSTADQSSTRSGRAKGARTGRPTRATRRRKAETDEDSYADVDTPAMDVSTQSTRSTRASRKQTTDSENDRNSESASSNRSTRATRNTKAKTMAPPILKLQATRGRDNSDEDMEVDTIEEKQVRIKSDRDSIDRDSALASTTDSPKSSFCSVETGSQKAATEDRLDSFHKLSVKGKAQAYEELVKRASREDSGTECDTPETKTPMKENVPKTPNTVIAKQQTATPRRPVPDETEPHSPAVSEMDTNEETPVRAAQPSTAEKARKARRSSRVSGLRTSMQRKRSSIANKKLQVALLQREMTVSQEPESRDSPARPQREPPVRHESESTDSDLVAQTPEKKTRPARSKLRLKKSKPAEEATVSTSTEEEGFTSPKPHAKATRMTRSKMRPPPQVTATPESHSSEDNDKTPVVQGFSVPEEVPPCRSTRSKMRLPASSPKRGIQDNQKTGATPSKKQRCDEESPKTPKAESDDEEWEDEQTPVQPARTRPKILKPLRAGLCLSSSAKKKPSNLCSVSSFLSRHNTPTHNTTITSFIARNASPKKISAKEQLLLKRKELEEKERAQLEKQQKKQELLKKRAEEQKRKREEKMLQVVQRRQEQEKREQEMLQGLVRKQEEKKTMTARMKEDKKREERERLRLRQVKMAEAEERRKQEEEQRLQKLKAQEEEQQRLEEMMRRKREFEERERQQKLAEQRRLEEERRLEAERERQREQLRLKQLEEQRAREEQQRQKEREERERREKEERERLEFEKLREKERLRQQELERQREQERQRYLQEKQQAAQEAAQREEERKARAALQKHNTSVNKPNTTLNMSAMKPTTKLNTTVTKDNSSESYIMTPQKKEIRQPICEENYDITNLRSDDSSEDEDNPKKKIPNWARGHALKAALLSQHDNPPDIIALFGHMVELDLNNLFEKKKSRFNKRTSSAIWTSPIMKP